MILLNVLTWQTIKQPNYFSLLIFYTSPRQWGLRVYLLLAKVKSIMNFIVPSPYGSVRTRSKWLTDNSDATDLFFHGFFYFWNYLFLDFLRIVFAPVRRGLPIAREVCRLRKIGYNQSTVKAHRNPIKTIIHKQDPWKNKSVASVLSVIDFERDERAKGEGADL